MVKINSLGIVLFLSFSAFSAQAAPSDGGAVSSPEDRADLVNHQMDMVEAQKEPQDNSTAQSSPDTPQEYPSSVFEQPAVVPLKPNPLFERKHNFDFGQETYYYRYVEPSARVWNRGVMTGYYGHYMYRPPKGNMFNNEVVNVYGFEGQYAQGDLNYKGSGILKDKVNKTYDVRGILGKDYIFSDASRVTPYFGFGYRYLIDHSSGRLSSDGHIGYNRESNYYYVPVGVRVDLPSEHAWSIGFNLEYDHFLQGVQRSHTSDTDQFRLDHSPDLRNHQSRGFGLRASMKFMRQFSWGELYFEPFWRMWRIDRSSLQSATITGTFSDGWNEPKNTTTEVGSKVGLQF